MGGRKVNKSFFVLVITIIILVAGLSVCIHNIVTSTKNPVAYASANKTCGQVPMNISFKAKGYDPDGGEIKFYKWDFGDGNTSDKRNPTHTYYCRGKFFAILTVTDEDGEKGKDTLEINIIDYQSPIAIAYANVTCGKAPIEIHFKGSGFDSNGIIDSYQWNFDDGYTDNNQNTTHIYNSPGRYFVDLIVTDNDGIIGIDTLEINIIENSLPDAYASADVTSGGAPLTVKFIGKGYDNDGKIISYHWIFEDTINPENRESNNRNTSHTFWFPGTYLVTLTVEDDDGAKDTDKILINVDESLFSWALEFSFGFLVKIVKRKIS
jgi:PKD repeat protein